jgi:hypothetical protein
MHQSLPNFLLHIKVNSYRTTKNKKKTTPGATQIMISRAQIKKRMREPMVGPPHLVVGIHRQRVKHIAIVIETPMHLINHIKAGRIHYGYCFHEGR